MSDPIIYSEIHQNEYIEDLKEILRIPSISTESSHSKYVFKCAEFLINKLHDIGIQRIELIETEKHPIIYAEHISGDSVPTVLIYGHYDVQPPDPYELWNSDPFEPIIKDNKIYARGANDNKGQLFIILSAVESIMKSEGKLPCNIKILLEGEEEAGSVSISDYIRNNSQKLKADFALVCDTAMLAEDIPAITISLRGILYVELTLQGPDRDLHSGAYGGAVENPLNRISQLMAGIHDEHNRITIPGFYNDVIDLDEFERRTIQAVPFDEKEWLSSIGIKKIKVEKGFSIVEATTARPTFDIHGILGGYNGEGVKSVIPAKAGVKFSFRLVPNQNPKQIYEYLKTYIDSEIKETFNYELRQLAVGSPVIMDTENPAMKTAVKALNRTFDSTTYFIRDGGSIPIVTLFKDFLKIDTILMGFGLESDAIHSPNEHFGLDRFSKGIKTVIMFLKGIK